MKVTGDGEQVIADRYRLIGRVGGGGMGVVWRAYDERLHRTVAVKRLHMPADLTDAQAAAVRRRTMREGRVAARLQHRHSITVFDVVEDDGCPYLVMEYLPSISLAGLLQERRSLEPVAVARLGAQVAAALAMAHEVGVVHRDVKPGNVLLGDDGTVKITDFGVSRVVEVVTGTTTREVAGTPAYLSPEVAQGKQATFASDVFSLGAMLYTAVEGRPPYGHADNVMKVLFQAASGDIEPPTRAGPMTDVLSRMMAIDPRARLDMDAVRDALAAIVATAENTSAESGPAQGGPAQGGAAQSGPVEAAPTTAEPPSPNRGRRLLLVGIAVSMVAIISAVVALNWDDPDPGTAVPAPSTTTTQAPTTAQTTTTPDATSPPPAPAEPPPAPATPPSTTPAEPQAPANPRTPQEAITGYYALMPGDLMAGWSRLTAKYQRSPAGGEDGYRTFWDAIAGVGVSSITASGNVVEATVDYAFKDGRDIRERHRYFLVRADDTWKIDESIVLSSVGR